MDADELGERLYGAGEHLYGAGEHSFSVDERFFEYDDFGSPLDLETRQRRAGLRRMLEEHSRMSPEECLAYLVKLGTHHPDGTLTEHYCDNGEPSKHRPTD
jgi:hypothetical protein